MSVAELKDTVDRLSAEERLELAACRLTHPRSHITLHPSRFTFHVCFMNRIVIDPDICNGQPVIQGTRITAQTVLEFLAAGDAIEDVLEEYPTLTRQDVLECVRFSSQLMKHHFSLREVI